MRLPRALCKSLPKVLQVLQVNAIKLPEHGRLVFNVPFISWGQEELSKMRAEYHTTRRRISNLTSEAVFRVRWKAHKRNEPLIYRGMFLFIAREFGCSRSMKSNYGLRGRIYAR